MTTAADSVYESTAIVSANPREKGGLTVGEAITLLQQYPQDLPLLIGEYTGGSNTIGYISKGTVCHEGGYSDCEFEDADDDDDDDDGGYRQVTYGKAIPPFTRDPFTAVILKN